MTREQEQAASAARRACIAWLRNPATRDSTQTAAYLASITAWHDYLAGLPLSERTAGVKKAFLAAWRTQWEAR